MTGMEFTTAFNYSYTGFHTMSPLSMVVSGIVVLLTIAGMWKMFQKAGYKGWYSLIPVWNCYIMLKVAKMKGWLVYFLVLALLFGGLMMLSFWAGKAIWGILYMIFIFIWSVIAIVIRFRQAKVFGKSWLFGLGLLFLPFIFYPILGFGKSEYHPEVFEKKSK